jgi:nucleotide-binding universal stress UspA family protein
MATKPVIVGVDGSEESLLAVEWAALEARRHASPLRIVSAPDVMPRMHAYHASPAEIAAALRGISARALDAAKHGHPTGPGPGIGSVQQAVLDHAHGPVAAVPAGA